MKGIKFISVLLLISIGILIGHNVIPHHHHVAMMNHPSSHECPAGDHDHHDEDHDDKHCHAFNDIQFIKDNHSELPLPENYSFLIMTADQGLVPEPKTSSSCTIHPRQSLATLSASHSGIYSLRGPPALS